MKIRPLKQAKQEESHDGSSPLKVEPKAIDPDAGTPGEVSNRSDTSRKPWIDKCQQWVAEQSEQVAEPPPLEPVEDDDPPLEDPVELALEASVGLENIHEYAFQSFSSKDTVLSDATSKEAQVLQREANFELGHV